MISANTAAIIKSAETLSRQADIIEAKGRELEQMLRGRRDKERVLLFFKRPKGDIDRMANAREEIVKNLRTQSLFLKECAKRYRGVQSRAIIRADRI